LIKKIHYKINLAHTSTKTFKDNSSPTILVNKIFSMEKLNTVGGGDGVTEGGMEEPNLKIIDFNS